MLFQYAAFADRLPIEAGVAQSSFAMPDEGFNVVGADALTLRDGQKEELVEEDAAVVHVDNSAAGAATLAWRRMTRRMIKRFFGLGTAWKSGVLSA